jgi:large subunit ribosomal protein L21e
MVQRIGGSRRKSRNKFTKHYRRKGKISLTQFFQKYNEGEHVALNAEVSYQKGMYLARMHGKIGRILGKQGTCYKVGIADGNKDKTIIVHPVHLRRL